VVLPCPPGQKAAHPQPLSELIGNNVTLSRNTFFLGFSKNLNIPE